MTPALLVVAAYLIGAIPASYIAGRMAKGIDLREHGSGNLGATNTFRVLGAKVAAPVVIFDILKGTFPVVAFSRWDGSADWRWELAYGAAAIIGHVFPVYMRFRGGKGVATSAGVFLALAPEAVGLGLLTWLVVIKLTRMVSAGSIAAGVVVGVLLGLNVPAERLEVRILGGLIVAFIIFAHRANVGRILRGEEHRFGMKKEPRATVAAAAVTADAKGAE
ncbi:MAG: Acyl-phosphate:glycerol-3-phosphate O-acyltransferase PlsY (EC [uncultured Gemmatimonadetes bacterium]|uniref:Glycerol-3-phosphate acyltransferase n=1 Tax=uncultured Gemmatimonadota bacterium TaxID=203437 RepID=A0A6J4MUP6_9BACT|nr:MAG: Acyl-phosphate:glycerol-3-phosphate O-acyltransferase PlsY (EC [uncultured Gemmatimonadota bacterium]